MDKIETDKNSIHLLLSMKPQHSMPSVVKTLKGQPAKIVGGETIAIETVYRGYVHSGTH
ncbi:transposase [Trichococcus patagoniensis]|uniref:transposase n=1 Tax=Trichococcus patagoniensis TaxID=382641 RepID=UPI000D3ACCA9